jgi:hypothetical protein
MKRWTLQSLSCSTHMLIPVLGLPFTSFAPMLASCGKLLAKFDLPLPLKFNLSIRKDPNSFWAEL